jgi:hypothetical protein
VGSSVSFVGINNPYVAGLERTTVKGYMSSGMWYIYHPEGYNMPEFDVPVVLVSEKEHITLL